MIWFMIFRCNLEVFGFWLKTMFYQLKTIDIHWKYTSKTWFSTENTMKMTTYRQPGDGILRSGGWSKFSGQTYPMTTWLPKIKFPTWLEVLRDPPTWLRRRILSRKICVLDRREQSIRTAKHSGTVTPLVWRIPKFGMGRRLPDVCHKAHAVMTWSRTQLALLSSNGKTTSDTLDCTIKVVALMVPEPCYALLDRWLR